MALSLTMCSFPFEPTHAPLTRRTLRIYCHNRFSLYLHSLHGFSLMLLVNLVVEIVVIKMIGMNELRVQCMISVTQCLYLDDVPTFLKCGPGVVCVYNDTNVGVCGHFRLQQSEQTRVLCFHVVI